MRADMAADLRKHPRRSRNPLTAPQVRTAFMLLRMVGLAAFNSRPLDPQNNQVVRCGALQCDFERKTALTLRPGRPI